MSDVTTRSLTLLGAVTSYARREILTWANAATTVRVFCTLGIFARPHDLVLVFAFALLGTASDAADGYLAKTFGGSNFGKRYDQYTDWCFAVAIMYAIVAAEGPTWYNLPLIVLIGGYLVIRARFPNADTNGTAKKKTIIQMVGVVVILAGHAFQVDSLVVLGYALLWLSLWYMAKALRDYSQHA